MMLANGRSPRNATLQRAMIRPRSHGSTPSCSREVAWVFEAR